MAAEKRDIKKAYLGGDPTLASFTAWPWPPHDWAALIAARKETNVQRDLLASELHRQNAHLPQAELVLRNIEALRHQETFTVTTGHQVCLLGGPMFTLYKVATAIAYAQKMAELFPENRFVPVLWMATEDHDWEEVNHFFLTQSEKVVYDAKAVGPVGRHILQAGISNLIPAHLPASLKASYHPGTTMAEAFRGLMHALFGHLGLVILDADRASLKQSFLPEMQRELKGLGMFEAVNSSSNDLEAAGFKAQIHARPINLFYLGDGDRSLIESTPEGLATKDGRNKWKLEEALAILEEHPEHFSPNVAFRPVYQEHLLPNIAYVGGWAEVNYWLQLRTGFEAFGTFFPLLVPRLHATILSHAQAHAWEGLGLSLTDLASPLLQLHDQYLEAHWDLDPLELALANVEGAMEHLAHIVSGFDPTLANSVKADIARQAGNADNLRKKLRKAIKNRFPKPFHAITELKDAIEPELAPQQRTLNFSAFDSVNPLTLVELLVAHADKVSEHQWIKIS